MLFRPNPSSGVPIYLQLMEQVKHAIATGALRPGEQLPGMRKVAEELVINPNTVAKAYRELEHEGVIELRQGAGAFVSEKAPSKKAAEKFRAAQTDVAATIEKLRAAWRGGRRHSAPVRSGAIRHGQERRSLLRQGYGG